MSHDAGGVRDALSALDSEYDAVVFDLDGTLVELLVDWDATATEAEAALAEQGVDAAGVDLWTMLDLADKHDVRPTIEDILSTRECDGAEVSERLPLADTVADLSVPVGVCSLNCERACRVALDVHDLDADVDAVVGRDSVATRKPHPEPLLATLRGLNATPESAVFVGDSPRDEESALAAEVDFLYVDAERSGN
ncbi:HAD family hydrolase [Halobium salinum]|uniref:HAD family hydrolase n=1 Tax=Halobium salinum TaxID=1364940 RepID=A0ABD5PAU0_9EURY|nr:HAD hydrolase-like protein [Halobium salinum]